MLVLKYNLAYMPSVVCIYCFVCYWFFLSDIPGKSVEIIGSGLSSAQL